MDSAFVPACVTTIALVILLSLTLVRRRNRSRLEVTSPNNGFKKPVNEIHWADGEMIHLLVLPERSGGWQSKIWGNCFARQWFFPTAELAEMRTRQLFRKSFPGHTCNERCVYFRTYTEGDKQARPPSPDAEGMEESMEENANDELLEAIWRVQGQLDSILLPGRHEFSPHVHETISDYKITEKLQFSPWDAKNGYEVRY